MEEGIIPSRRALLSRIELVCDLDSSFIVVTGDTGMGKSSLLEFFIEHHCPGRQKCFIAAVPDQSVHELKEHILSQLAQGNAYDPNLSLLQNLKGFEFEQFPSAIILLDNAQLIDNELFVELIEALKQCQSVFQLSVLFAQSSDQQRFSHLNSQHPLIEIHLEGLNKTESRLLLEFYYRSMMDSDRVEVQRFIERSNGIPAKLLQWAEPSQTAAKKPLKISKNTVITVVVVSMLVCVVAAASWYFISAQQERELLAEQTPAVADTAAGDLAKKEQKDAAELDALLVQKWSDPTQKGIPAIQVAAVVATQEEDLDKPDDESPAEKEPVKAAEQDSERQDAAPTSIDETAEEVTDEATEEVADDATDTDEPEQKSVESLQQTKTTEPVEQEQIEQTLNDKMDNPWFIAQPAGRFVIQLSGMSDENVLETYLRENKLEPITRVYQSIRNGYPWYVVTMGDHASFALAKSAIAKLSKPLQDAEPWVKSISTIQSEISNANKKNQ
jgi:DamX protein